MVGLGAAAQGVTGFGFSLVSAPFLIAAYHAPLGVQLNLLLSVGLNACLILLNRRSIRISTATSLFVPAAAATVVAGYYARSLTGNTWTIGAGVLCLVGTLVIWSGVSFPRLRGRLATVAIGGLSGAMNVTTGVGGPPTVLFTVNAGWPPAVSRATMQAFFFGINAVGLATIGLPDRLPLPVIPALMVGLLIGTILADRVPAGPVRTVSLALSAIGSILAMSRGL
jgi:uncharacterized protein